MDKNTKDIMFSSKTTLYGTPKNIFEPLNKLFKYTLDAAATYENTLCSQYFDAESNALTQEWFGRIWLNPPYGKKSSPEGSTGEWVTKAFEEFRKHPVEHITLLVPARVDTSVWHGLIFKESDAILFLQSRLKFIGAKDSAPFPSALIFLDKGGITNETVKGLSTTLTGTLLVGGRYVRCKKVK